MIRDLFASTQDAKAKGYKKGRFSFNVKGGRCESAAATESSRLKCIPARCICTPARSAAANVITGETLEVKYKGKSILTCWI